MFEHFRAFDRAVILVTSVAVVALTALMTIVVLIGVFARYILHDALPWIEEAARYAMLWLSWLGGGLALRRGAHLAVEFLVDAMTPQVRAVTIFIGRIAVLAFLALCAYFGLALVQRVSAQSTAALGVSMQLPYASVSIGSLLMIYHLLVIMFGPKDAVTRDTELQV
jgi:TRAP-type transport system small permease protein